MPGVASVASTASMAGKRIGMSIAAVELRRQPVRISSSRTSSGYHIWDLKVGCMSPADQLGFGTNHCIPTVPVERASVQAETERLQLALAHWKCGVAKRKAGANVGSSGDRSELHVGFDLMWRKDETVRGGEG